MFVNFPVYFYSANFSSKLYKIRFFELIFSLLEVYDISRLNTHNFDKN